jgi:hypothetical protein
MKFGPVKDHELTYEFHLNHVFLKKLIIMTMVQNFEVMLGKR